MSEYYKIIEKLNVFRHVDSAFTARHIVSAASSKTGIAGALQQHDICFSFAAKMAADTNQLKELHEFLHAGNEDSAKRLTQTLNSKGQICKDPCLSQNENHRLKTFYASLHLK